MIRYKRGRNTQWSVLLSTLPAPGTALGLGNPPGDKRGAVRGLAKLTDREA